MPGRMHSANLKQDKDSLNKKDRVHSDAVDAVFQNIDYLRSRSIAFLISSGRSASNTMYFPVAG